MFKDFKLKSSLKRKDALTVDTKDLSDVNISWELFSKQKDEQIKILETKLSECRMIICEKNNKLIDANKVIEQTNEEYQLNLKRFQSRCQLLEDKLTSQTSMSLSESKLECAELRRQLTEIKKERDILKNSYESLTVEKDEMHNLSIQETSKVKHLLLNAERELELCRNELDKQSKEFDESRNLLAQLKSENTSLQQLIHDLRKLRNEELETSQFERTDLNKLMFEKDSLTFKVEELTEQLIQAIDERKQFECTANEQKLCAKYALEELEQLRIKYHTEISQSHSRETDLNDQIHFLEKQINSLTENISQSILINNEQNLSSEIRNSSMNESVLNSSSGLSEEITNSVSLNEEVNMDNDNSNNPCNPIQNIESINVGDVRNSTPSINVLLSERQVLTDRLEAMRVHLSEVKNEWNDCLLALERQISHLNAKITEDTEEHNKLQKEYEKTINNLQKEVETYKSQLNEANRRTSEAEVKCIEIQKSAEIKQYEWEQERINLVGKNSGLLEQANVAANERFEARQSCIKLQINIEELERSLNQTKEQISRLEKDLKDSKDQLAARIFELDQLSIKHDSQTKRIQTMNEQIEKYQHTVQEYRNQVDHYEKDMLMSNEKAEQYAMKLQAVQSKNQDLMNQIKTEQLLTQEKLKIKEAELFTTQSKLEVQTNEMEKLKQQMSEIEQITKSKMQSIQNEEIKKLKQTIDQRDKVIRLLQQRLKEMKKLLGDQFKVTQTSSDLDSMDGMVSYSSSVSPSNENDRACSPSRISVGSANSIPISLPEGFSSNGTTTNNYNSTNHNNKFNQNHLNFEGDEQVSSTNDSKYGYDINLSQSSLKNQPHFIDRITHRYLRHVLLKFLLSRENEALQLMRVLSALLYLTAEEENLIRQTLTARRKWFRTRHFLSSSKSHGQFAKIIPPSL